MKDIKESVNESLDGSNIDLYPYLPYLLQDLYEVGTDPRMVSKIIAKNFSDPKSLKILDLGCGKGAVSIRLAKEFGCTAVGIDAIPEFVESAKRYAQEQKVNRKCHFVLGDIRKSYKNYTEFDLVVLGAIGPVLGSLHETLIKVSHCLKSSGYIILDECYTPDNSSFVYDKCGSRNQFYGFIKAGGYSVVEEMIIGMEYMQEQNRIIFDAIKRRANDLIAQHPEKSQLFSEYLIEQETENNALENELFCGIWLLQRKD
jgi:cyclopropane fatty-acyl-phospholipid synthase-like methyltransferase